MLQLSHTSVSIEEKQIVHDFSFSFFPGHTYALLGKNGSGKSSLAFALFHHPRYTLSGEVLLHQEVINNLAPNVLSEKGMFLSFQNVPEIPGIRLIEYLRTIYNHSFERTHPGEKTPTPFVFRRMVEKMLPEYGIDSKFLDRDLYVGFSGGEKRRIELLQIALLDPKIILLDEIDSGLDIGALEILSTQIQKWRSMSKIVIIISHNFHLLDTVNVDGVIIMKDGQIVRHGEKELIEEIRKNGF
ncbi:Fe-S cluster assembly ATPase SufC [Candidatus Gracilibacteria bacterium]|nr:Fe-S cluster assembly ATPase SufC [Candidatus Gracilibacteria bacterium]